MIGEFVIVRSRDQGVMVGELIAVSGTAVELNKPRQLYGWQDGANTLCEVSVNGVGFASISEPSAGRVLILNACGVYQCTKKAKANLSQSRWNQPYDPSK